MPAPKTLLYMTAARPDEIPVDASDFDDAATEPMLPIPERPTGRPSSESQAALVVATKATATWAAEPRFAIDPESGCLVLVEPFYARQTSASGVTFLVECPAGLELDPPATRAQARAIRTALVIAALKVSDHFWLATRGGAEIHTPLDGQWRVQIVSAFRDGDAGAIRRG